MQLYVALGPGPKKIGGTLATLRFMYLNLNLLLLGLSSCLDEEISVLQLSVK